MVLVEEEGETGPIPERARMNSGGGRGGFGPYGRGDMGFGLPPQYEEGNWPMFGQQRRGSIPVGISVQ